MTIWKHNKNRIERFRPLMDDGGAMSEHAMMMMFCIMAGAAIFILLGRALFRVGHEGQTTLLGRLGLALRQACGYRSDSDQDVGAVKRFLIWLFDEG